MQNLDGSDVGSDNDSKMNWKMIGIIAGEVVFMFVLVDVQSRPGILIKCRNCILKVEAGPWCMVPSW